MKSRSTQTKWSRLQCFLSHLARRSIIILALPFTAVAGSLDYDNNRIAMSFDGNSAPDPEYKWPTGDPDDWGAIAASCAIIAKLELQEKLVHCSYNNFIDAPSGPDSENQMKISADGAQQRWGFEKSTFFDVTTQLDKAVADLASEMAKSTQKDPLYFIHAGLSEFVYLAVEKVVDQGKVGSLSHVYFISHSGFNENEKRRATHRTWDDIKVLTANRMPYKKIVDQNQKGDPNALWHSGSNFSVWHWMRDHSDPNLRWLYSRAKVHAGKVADISDCGMLYYLLAGDEKGSPEKFKKFLGKGIDSKT